MRRALWAIVLALAGTVAAGAAPPAAAAGWCPNDARAFRIACQGSLPALAQRVNVIGWHPYAELGEQSINRRTCRDLDGDGDVDFAIEVAVAPSPAPRWSSYTSASGMRALASPTGAPRPCAASSARVALIMTEPRYAGSDAHCRPSRIAVRKIFHRPGRFTSTTRITQP